MREIIARHHNEDASGEGHIPLATGHMEIAPRRRSRRRRMYLALTSAILIGLAQFTCQVLLDMRGSAESDALPITQVTQLADDYSAFLILAISALGSFAIINMGLSPVLARRYSIGGLVAAATIAAAASGLILQGEFLLNSEGLYWNNETGEIHFVEVLRIFHPIFSLFFFPSAIVIVSLLWVDALGRRRQSVG